MRKRNKQFVHRKGNSKQPINMKDSQREIEQIGKLKKYHCSVYPSEWQIF